MSDEQEMSSYRFGSTETEFEAKMRVSDVTRVSPRLLAVATRKRSAGSRCGNLKRVVSSTISAVRGASFRNAAALIIQSATSHSSVMRPFSTRSANSHMLTGESQTSLAAFASDRPTLLDSRSGAS